MSTTASKASSEARSWIVRPSPTADPREQTAHRTIGLALAGIGLLLVVVSAIASWGTITDLTATASAGTLAWTFATTVTGFGLAKVGIGITLVGIILRLWHRANAIATVLPALHGSGGDTGESLGDLTTAQGPAVVTDAPPTPLPIHRMAQAMWLPVLAMGAMALAAGFVLGVVSADAQAGSEAFRRLSAWTQGTLFLGEGLLLSGISLLLGTILASLRQAGGEIQHSLGVRVRTLKMPASAKAFIALMATGMMMAIAQFFLYIAAASRAADPAAFATWATWLGPFRETALGILLAGIVLALFTISKVLAFQFDRVTRLAQPTA